MISCAAYRCNNWSEDTKKGVTFHRFPVNDPQRVRQWVKNMKRGKWTPSARSVLCSKHFEDGCFDRSGPTVHLRPSAVPTVFPISVRLQKKSRFQKNPKRPLSVTQLKTPISPSLVPLASNPVISSPIVSPVCTWKTYDHNYAILDSPRQLKSKVDILNEQLDVLKKKFKYEKQKSTRLKMKVSRISFLIKSLNGEGFQ